MLAAWGVAACGSSVEAGPAATAQSAATKAPVATTAHTGHVRLVGEALGEVPLRADQRTAIEQLAADAETRHAASRSAHADVMNALAAQVEAGKIDRAALQPKLDAAAEAWRTSRPADRAALEKLHGILDKDQRSAFVDALVAKMHAQRGEHHGHEHMQQLAADLKLTDDQRAQIGAIMKEQFSKQHDEQHGDWKEAHAKGKGMLEAFKGDHFVMDEVAPPVDPHAKVNEMSGHFLDVVEKVLPILTPEQRTLAAAKIRERANDADMMAPGMP